MSPPSVPPRGGKNCDDCDWYEVRQHLRSEVERVGRSVDGILDRINEIDQQLRDMVLGVAAELRETQASCDARNAKAIGDIRDAANELKVKVGKLEVKASVVGAVAGAVATGVIAWFQGVFGGGRT